MTPATTTPRQEGAGTDRFRARQARANPSATAAARPGFSTYIEVEALPSQAVGSPVAASACGNRRRCGSTRPAAWRFCRQPQPRPGPRDHVRAARGRAPGHRSTTYRLFTATPTRSSSAWVLRPRSGAVGTTAIVKALDKVEAKAKKVASSSSRRRHRHRVQGRPFRRGRHRQPRRGTTSPARLHRP